MSDPGTETPNSHMLESMVGNAPGSSESGSDVESTSSSSPKTNSSSSKSGRDEVELSVQYDNSRDSIVFTNGIEGKGTRETNCDYCNVLDKENEECSKRIAALEEKCSKLEQINNELNSKVELVSIQLKA